MGETDYEMDTQRLNDEMFGKRNTSGGKVILVILAILLALVLALVVTVAASAKEHMPLDYSDYGCKPYTYGMVTGHQAAAMTHSKCNQGETSTDKRNNSDADSLIAETSIVTASPIVTPVIAETPNVPSIDETPTVEPQTPTESPNPTESPVPTETPDIDPPAEEVKQKCNSGRGNGSELDASGNDCDPGRSGSHNKGGD
jgi:hypothetical protein